MAAAVLMVVAGVNLFLQSSHEQEIALARIAVDDGAADFDILTQDTPLEFYQDLEFYYWLEQGGERAG
jgi:hypothetical protein